MKVFITHPIPEKNLQAGLTYELKDKDAAEIIEQDKGYEVKEIKEAAKKKVKNGNG
jgi:hypothetical protein